MRPDLTSQLYFATRRLPASVRATTEREVTAALSEASTVEDFRAVARDRKCSAVSRARALWILRLLHDRTVRAELAIWLTERPGNPLFLWEVAKTIVALRPPRISVTVHRMLREKAPSSREIAAWLLGFAGGNASNALLKTVLAEDEDASVRAQAAESLGTLCSKRSVPPLIDALRDRSARVRSSAAYALAEIGDPAALAALHARRNDRAKVNSTTVGSDVRRTIRKLKAVLRRLRGRASAERRPSPLALELDLRAQNALSDGRTESQG